MSSVGVAFQQTCFQFPAFQGALNPVTEYGYSTIVAMAQAGGVQPAQPVFLSGSRCIVVASYYDVTGTPMVPFAVSYRIDDVFSGQTIVAWTPLPDPPGLTNQIVVSSNQNAYISLSRPSETRKVTFMITDGYGVAYLATGFYNLNPAGGVFMTSLAFQGWQLQPGDSGFQNGAFQTGNSIANL